MRIEKYSFGLGDRFAQQGKAQLSAIKKAKEAGINITPVWNKSYREHTTIHSNPADVRTEADTAVGELNWNAPYFVDADHINLNTVDHFIEYADFFTLDVADYIGQKADEQTIKSLIAENKKFIGSLSIPGIEKPFNISEDRLKEIAEKFALATQEAGKIYRHIAERKGADQFITEVSMDEVDEAQTPVELFFILSFIAQEGIPAQTIAPKFTGRFNKGVDYEGDVTQFAREFEEDLLVIDEAIKQFDLPENLKLSVHSGSDKFTIYPVMGALLKKYDKGIHVKTAGTSWLEEMIGLAMAKGSGLEMAKNIYYKALDNAEKLCAPYATVIDIDMQQLPSKEEVAKWDSDQFANALRHIPGHPEYNPHFRQLIHVGYKIAAEYSNVYIHELLEAKEIIFQQVETNIYDRHIKRLFNL